LRRFLSQKLQKTKNSTIFHKIAYYFIIMKLMKIITNYGADMFQTGVPTTKLAATLKKWQMPPHRNTNAFYCSWVRKKG
jgi:hypothetical protein